MVLIASDRPSHPTIFLCIHQLKPIKNMSNQQQPIRSNSSASSLSLSPKGRCTRILRLVAVHPHSSSDPSHLSFPARAIIEAKKGQEGNALWYGSYQGQRGWFPVGFCRLQELPAALLLRAPSLPMLPQTKLPAATMTRNYRSLSMNNQAQQGHEEQHDISDDDSMNSDNDDDKNATNSLPQQYRPRSISLDQRRHTPPPYPPAATKRNHQVSLQNRYQPNTAPTTVTEEAPPSRVEHREQAAACDENNAAIEFSRSRSNDSSSTRSSAKRGLSWFKNKKCKEGDESPRSILGRGGSATHSQQSSSCRHPQSPVRSSNKSQNIKSPPSASSARNFFSLKKGNKHVETSCTKVPINSCLIRKNNTFQSDSSSLGSAASPASTAASAPPPPLESIYIPSPQRQRAPSHSSAPGRMVRFSEADAELIAPPHKSDDDEPEDPIEVYAAAYRSRMRQMDELHSPGGGLEGLLAALSRD